MSRSTDLPHLARTALGLALALGGVAWMPVATAQSAPASSASTANAHAMDMGAMPMGDMPMPRMDHATHAGHAPAAASSSPIPEMRANDHGTMPGMKAMHGASHPAAAASSMSDMKAMPGMRANDHGTTPDMKAMQHGDGHAAHASSMSRMASMPGMDHPTHDGDAPAAASSSMPGMPAMDHGAMPAMKAMQLGGHPPATATSSMSGMDAMSGMDPAAQDGGMAGMSMGAMQGGAAPAGARSPDYSDGYRHSTMPGMDMVDSAPLAMLLVDQLEAFHGHDGNGQSLELQGWYGGDADKLWLRSEGERSGGRLEDGDVEALWSHAVAPYWDSTLGVRHDFGEGPSRDWLAAGVQGLAPYWFDVEATLYLGTSGRSAARVRASYDVLFTQRLILQPEWEANLYGRRDPARGLGRGLTDVQFGLRLRYEVRREFAPYVGVQFVQRLGNTADLARAAGRPVFDRQFVAGLRFWF
jgi:copper resistance protein B